MDHGPRSFIFRILPTNPALLDGQPLDRVQYPNLKSARGQELGQEAWLQEALKRHPELLLVDRLDPHADAPVFVARELDTLGQGTLDLLYLDLSGVLTLVETKLARNPELRRQVMSQTIDYASFLSNRTYDEIQDLLITEDQPWSHEENLAAGLWKRAGRGEPTGDAYKEWEQAFRTRLEDNLRRRCLRLLIVSDQIDPRLRNMTEFLFAGARPEFQIGLIEVALFTIPGVTDRTLVVPSIYWSRTPSIPTLQIDAGEKVWATATFIEQTRRNNADDPDTVAMVEEILAWMKERVQALEPNAWLEGGKSLPSHPSMNLKIRGLAYAVPHLEGSVGGAGWISCRDVKKQFPEQLRAFLQKIQAISPYESLAKQILAGAKSDFKLTRAYVGDPAVRKRVLAAMGDLQEDILKAK
jgi:hypothetical protein